MFWINSKGEKNCISISEKKQQVEYWDDLEFYTSDSGRTLRSTRARQYRASSHQELSSSRMRNQEAPLFRTLSVQELSHPTLSIPKDRKSFTEDVTFVSSSTISKKGKLSVSDSSSIKHQKPQLSKPTSNKELNEGQKDVVCLEENIENNSKKRKSETNLDIYTDKEEDQAPALSHLETPNQQKIDNFLYRIHKKPKKQHLTSSNTCLHTPLISAIEVDTIKSHEKEQSASVAVKEIPVGKTSKCFDSPSNRNFVKELASAKSPFVQKTSITATSFCSTKPVSSLSSISKRTSPKKKNLLPLQLSSISTSPLQIKQERSPFHSLVDDIQSLKKKHSVYVGIFAKSCLQPLFDKQLISKDEFKLIVRNATQKFLDELFLEWNPKKEEQLRDCSFLNSDFHKVKIQSFVRIELFQIKPNL